MKILGLEWKDFLTILLALYGSLVTTILAIMKRREYSYQVAVFCDVETDGANHIGETKERLVMVRAVNEGHRTLEITRIGFRERSGTLLANKLTPPIKLEPGLSLTERFNSADVLSRLESFTGVFAEDSARRVYKSSLSDFVKKKIRLAPVLDVAEILINTTEQFNQSRQILSDAASKLVESQERQLQDLKQWAEERNKKHETWDRYLAETGRDIRRKTKRFRRQEKML